MRCQHTNLPINININNINISFNIIKKYYYINNIKICQDDILLHLFNSIFYNSQNDYDNYLKNLNNLPLKIYNIINNGVILSCIFDDNGYMINIKLNFCLENNKKYLILNNKKYTINNINNIYKITRPSIRKRYSINEFYNLLKNSITEDLSIKPENIIEEGKENYKLFVKGIKNKIYKYGKNLKIEFDQIINLSTNIGHKFINSALYIYNDDIKYCIDLNNSNIFVGRNEIMKSTMYYMGDYKFYKLDFTSLIKEINEKKLIELGTGLIIN